MQVNLKIAPEKDPVNVAQLICRLRDRCRMEIVRMIGGKQIVLKPMD